MHPGNKSKWTQAHVKWLNALEFDGYLQDHESPIFSYRHYLETGHPEHWMFLRHTALASVTSVTYDNETGRVMSITYVDPAANVK